MSELIVEANYITDSESKEYVAVEVTLTNGEKFVTKNITEVGDILILQSESAKLADNASALIGFLVKESDTTNFFSSQTISDETKNLNEANEKSKRNQEMLEEEMKKHYPKDLEDFNHKNN